MEDEQIPTTQKDKNNYPKAAEYYPKEDYGDLRRLSFAYGGRFVMDTTEPPSAWRPRCKGCRMNVERSDDGLRWISRNMEQSDGQLLTINWNSERLECRSHSMQTAL